MRITEREASITDVKYVHGNRGLQRTPPSCNRGGVLEEGCRGITAILVELANNHRQRAEAQRTKVVSLTTAAPRTPGSQKAVATWSAMCVPGHTAKVRNKRSSLLEKPPPPPVILLLLLLLHICHRVFCSYIIVESLSSSLYLAFAQGACASPQ